MSSATPILTYFDSRGLAELIRLEFTVAGVEFVDNRLPRDYSKDSKQGVEWLEYKPKTPFHQIPTLTVGDVIIPQSNAIVRYVAQQHGLAGSSPLEAAVIDAGYESVNDLRRSYSIASKSNDAEKVAAFLTKDLVDRFALLNANTKGPFYAGEKLSYTDLQIYYSLWVLAIESKEVVDGVLAANPKIAAIFSGVEKNEKIAAYLATRKVTQF